MFSVWEWMSTMHRDARFVFPIDVAIAAVHIYI